jgi:multicomponent Na+:H+ antiporter subunit G
LSLNAIEIGKIIVAILIVLGALFNLLGAIGLLRLPDVYLRSHAATKSATLGVVCILAGAFIFFWIDTKVMNARLLLGLVFVFITAPVAGHLICRAAYRTKVPLWEKSIQDDLKDKLSEDEYLGTTEK